MHYVYYRNNMISVLFNCVPHRPGFVWCIAINVKQEYNWGQTNIDVRTNNAQPTSVTVRLYMSIATVRDIGSIDCLHKLTGDTHSCYLDDCRLYILNNDMHLSDTHPSYFFYWSMVIVHIYIYLTVIQINLVEKLHITGLIPVSNDSDNGQFLIFIRHSVCRMAAISSRPQCVKRNRSSINFCFTFWTELYACFWS